MVKQKQTKTKSSSLPPSTLYVTLAVVGVAVALILIFALVPMGKKSADQVAQEIQQQEEQKAMEKLQKTEESGDVLLIISSITLGIGFILALKDLFFCRNVMDANKISQLVDSLAPEKSPITLEAPTNARERLRYIKNAGVNKALAAYAGVRGIAKKFNRESAIGCNPYLTYLICCASLVLSIIALTSQLSGKKMTETIIAQNEKTYVDNNNEENTEIMKQNEANLKSFKSNVLWAIILIVLAFIIVMGSLGIYYKYDSTEQTKGYNFNNLIKDPAQRALKMCGVDVTRGYRNSTTQANDPRNDNNNNNNQPQRV